MTPADKSEPSAGIEVECAAVIEVECATYTVRIHNHAGQKIRLPGTINSSDVGLYEMLARLTLSLLSQDVVSGADCVLWAIVNSTPPVAPMLMRVGDLVVEYGHTVETTNAAVAGVGDLDGENPRL